MSRSRVFLPAFLLAATACAQTDRIEPSGHPRQPNSFAEYAALRGNLPGAESVTVKDFKLEREGGVFTFQDGAFYLYAPVDGNVTGAVFSGHGHFDLAPKDAAERRSLALLTKNGSMAQDFTTVVLRFTDSTADEIRKASQGTVGAPEGHIHSLAVDLQKGFRKDLRENLDLRLLADVLAPKPGQFFLASFHMAGGLTGRNVLFVVDPEGTFHASPDQVELSTWSEFEVQPWSAYRMQTDDTHGGERTQVIDERLDATIERSGTMHIKAETTFKVLRDDVRVVRLNLYPTLRVSGVYDQTGAPLDFIQEAREQDADFAVVLPQLAKAGQTVRVLTDYAGKDALRADGNDSYYLMSGARESWYPAGGGGLGNFANFHMTFHAPKQLTVVATGQLQGVTAEPGGMSKTVWETATPIPVAGFNIGDFKSFAAKTPQGFGVAAYADNGLPDQFSSLKDAGTLGGLSATQALRPQVNQGLVAVQIYSNYFGKLPYDHVSLTEQTACNYGQSWPTLVYLPICGFWDKTVLQQLGLLDFDATYWTEVTPHEVSHQWWGNLVGFKSYRDQWMSEGFANFSVGIFLLNSNPKMDDFRAFWKEQQKNLLEKNREGVRPIDAGALTMGLRVSNSKSGEDVYQHLIYSKGAYVLHMLEMMYWTPGEQEGAFKRSMQQFVSDYSGKAATTEDWKASLEKTMPKYVDLRGDGKLDWFFDEYVYGTELPHYAITSDFSVSPDGVTSVHMKLTQSKVSPMFMMRIPIYLEMANGNTVRIANVVIHGSDSIDRTLAIGKLPSPAKTLLLNYNADVLSDN